MTCSPRWFWRPAAKNWWPPAMNTAMLENPITQDNLAALEKYGFSIIPPDSGFLACQAVGSGKMPEPEVLLDHIARELAREKTLAGVRGDSDGRPHPGGPGPGAATLPTTAPAGWGMPLPGRPCSGGAGDPGLRTGGAALGSLCETRPVTTAADMFRAVRDLLPATDVLIKAAAVAGLPGRPRWPRIR